MLGLNHEYLTVKKESYTYEPKRKRKVENVAMIKLDTIDEGNENNKSVVSTHKQKKKEKTKKFVNGEPTKIYNRFLLLGTNVVNLKKEKEIIN